MNLGIGPPNCETGLAEVVKKKPMVAAIPDEQALFQVSQDSETLHRGTVPFRIGKLT